METIESLRPGWRPPFCPNDKCPYHNELTEGWRYKKIGFYRRDCDHRRIQRYLCLHCRRSFGRQTFSPTYWKKRPALVFQVLELAASGACHRQMARALKCSPATIDHQMQHLGRHCLLFHLEQLERARPPTDVALDGLVTFELSQYFPFEHHVVVEVDHGYVLGFSDSPLRRRGTMTAWQRRRREELERRYGKPDPQAVRKDMHELLLRVLKGCAKVVVRLDEHKSYPPALRGLPCEIVLRVTSSRARRDRQNPLWEVNLLERKLRHDEANHRRETLAWAKRRQDSASRLWVDVVVRNCMRSRYVKLGGASPAMLKGLFDRVLTAGDVLARRLFPSRVHLTGRWREYYWREVVTPALGVNRRHEKVYAL